VKLVSISTVFIRVLCIPIPTMRILTSLFLLFVVSLAAILVVAVNAEASGELQPEGAVVSGTTGRPSLMQRLQSAQKILESELNNSADDSAAAESADSELASIRSLLSTKAATDLALRHLNKDSPPNASGAAPSGAKNADKKKKKHKKDKKKKKKSAAEKKKKKQKKKAAAEKKKKLKKEAQAAAKAKATSSNSTKPAGDKKKKKHKKKHKKNKKNKSKKSAQFGAKRNATAINNSTLAFNITINANATIPIKRTIAKKAAVVAPLKTKDAVVASSSTTAPAADDTKSVTMTWYVLALIVCGCFMVGGVLTYVLMKMCQPKKSEYE